MKLYKKAFLILSFGLTLNSCLDLDPQDQLADGNLWGAADDFKYFATNFYGWTRDFTSVISDGAHSDWRSDLMTSSSVNMYSNGSNPIPTSDGNYTSNYAHIRRCNLLLQKAASFSGNGDISRYVAEAKFFRAYSYFDLVQLFGDVIITKEPLDITSPELRMSRDDRSEVIDFVIQDLREAAEVLPETITTDDEGRISKWGAYAFLSRVALYEGTWQQNRNNEERGKALLSIAADAAKKVIDSKQFELFKPAALGEMAYKYLFILENVQSNPANLTKSANKEYIFYRRHDETIAPIGTNITHGCVANVQYINRKFVNMYLCSNGLPIDHAKSADVFKGYGGLTTEFENRDNRMKNCLLAHGTKYWDNDKPRIDWKGMDGEDRDTIQELSKSFRFISAKNADLAAKSFYNFVLKRSKDSGQWHYSESLMFEKEQDKLLPDGNIVENMSLVIATDRDTVLMGDTVRVSLRFKNISDKDKLFYPGGVIMIYEKSMRMSSSIMPPSFILSKGKSDQLQNIPSGLVYEINYPVIVSSPLFKEGENRLMFRYHWGLNLSKKNVTDNIIYGNLYSKEVRTYVGSDLCVFGL